MTSATAIEPLHLAPMRRQTVMVDLTPALLSALHDAIPCTPANRAIVSAGARLLGTDAHRYLRARVVEHVEASEVDLPAIDAEPYNGADLVMVCRPDDEVVVRCEALGSEVIHLQIGDLCQPIVATHDASLTPVTG